LSGKHVVVVGGSMAGLATACALARDGHRVTVLEKDAAPLPATPAEAFARWERRGSPQTRHSHAFLARLHNLLRDRAPDLLDLLLASGAERMTFREIVHRAMPDAELVPEDEDITMLACRRLTFEWVQRRYVDGLANVAFLDGVDVKGLVAGSRAPGERPVVSGVRLADGETLEADLVIDASGRRTRIGKWLEELGAAPLRVESEPCGIFYTSRFYRLREGAEMPNMDGPMGADLGFLKYGIFPGDSRIFSITLAASTADDPLRAVIRVPAFEALAAFLPATRAWVDPEIGEPISEVHSMTNLRNTRRFLVEDGEPVVLGITCVGDALIHTNPITGRGCTLGFVGAFALANALREHAGDPRAFALAFDAAIGREIVPWYDAMRQQDRDSIEVAELQRRGEDPFAVNREDGSVDPKAYMRSVLRDGFLPALREDVSVLRAFMRIFNLLDEAADLMKDPAVLARVLQVYARREERDPAERGPSRGEVLAQLERAAA
jgi:2-polyprenyl-6-methoxyphenol hydroxylase-like FAD-dependent oxidoreductase